MVATDQFSEPAGEPRGGASRRDKEVRRRRFREAQAGFAQIRQEPDLPEVLLRRVQAVVLGKAMECWR